MIELDDLHIGQNDMTKLESYNKRNIVIISPRELGKSTYPFILRSYFKFKETQVCTLAIRRYVTDITDLFLVSVENCINKFTDDNVSIRWRRGKSGITFGYIHGYEKPFMLIVPLNAPINRVKSAVLKVWSVQFDEFICNPDFKEKYLPSEAVRFEEVFRTFQRENPSLKAYFYGNPYSVFNPYFSSWNVDFGKLKPGAFYKNSNCVIKCGVLSEELKKQILSRNPGYVFDDSYERYAFGGVAINDENKVIVPSQPRGYRLSYCFYYDNKTLGVYQTWDYTADYPFWMGFVSDEGSRRKVFVYSFKDLVENTAMLGRQDRQNFCSFVNAISCRCVAYQNLEACYQAEMLYKMLGGR